MIYLSTEVTIGDCYVNDKAYFVYPEELRHSRRVTVFRDFLLRRIADDKK